MMLLPGAAAAQRSVFVEGLKELERAMLGDPARAERAVDKMEAALAVWPTESDRSERSLMGEESAPIPMLPLAAFAEGFDHIRRADYRKAVQSLRQGAATIGDERLQLAAAGRLAQEGRDVEAEDTLRRIVAVFPASGVARWWLARIYERLNKVTDARREYEKVAAIALTGRGPLYEAIGRLSYAEGNFERAAEAYEGRVQLEPENPSAHKDLARLHLEQGRADAALTALTTAVAIDPRDAEAHASIGRIRLDAGRPADAIPSLQRALTLMPALYEARYALAVALTQTGRPKEAARELELFERARRDSTDQRRRAMAEESNRQRSESPEGPR